MAVSGHQSLQSLALYTRVRDDEKLMMGMKLAYSLLKPEEARELRETTEETPQSIENNNEAPSQKKLKLLNLHWQL